VTVLASQVVTMTATNSSGTTSEFSSWVPSPPPPPTNVNQCKNGGWQTLFRTNGTQFKNQGDCIQYVNTGK